MEEVRNEIKNLFKICFRITNKSIYFLDDFLYSANTFRIISENSFEDLLKKEISGNGLSINSIYNSLIKTAFSDFNYIVDIQITDQAEFISSEYTIYMTEAIKSLLKEIHGNKNQDLSLNKQKIRNFFDKEMNIIKEKEVERYRGMINEYISKPKKKSWFFFPKKKEEDRQIGLIYFLLGDYHEAKEILKNDDQSEEFLFYCQLMCNEKVTQNYDFTNNNVIADTRKAYLYLKTYKAMNFKPFDIYFMLTRFEWYNSLPKCIFEMELSSILDFKRNINKRSVFSLYVSINILYENNYYRQCIELVEKLLPQINKLEIEKEVLLEYINEIRNKCLSRF